MSQAAPLSATGIRFSYGPRVILDGLSLDAEPGEAVGLVGPNGSGKTTFLRTISGTLTPEAGRVDVHGSELLSLSPRDRARRVAMVRQNPSVPLGFSALEVVLMGRNPHLGLLQWEGPKDMEVCRRVMELAEIWEFADRPLASLSGGELQRVFIARALAQETPVLLLDEPTAHLDISYQASILDTIETIRRETNMVVLIAMHDLTLAAQYCSRIAVLHRGSTLGFGRPSEVLTAEVISKAFGVKVSIGEHPVYKTPVVLAVARSAGSDAHSPGGGDGR